MTALQPTLVFRRTSLARAVHDLPPIDAKALLHLALHACPTTGRVWTTPVRLADELGLSATLVEHLLDRLGRAGFVRILEPTRRPLLVLELGPVFIRDGAAPGNVPVEDPV
jgi:DNA-binding MarR family transcriptional regulator